MLQTKVLNVLNNRIIRHSTVINNTYIDNSRHTTYVAGPDRNELQRTTGRTIRTVSVYENNRPGQNLQNDQLHIYRPRISDNGSNKRRVAPERYTQLNDVKRNPDHNSSNYKRNTYQSNDINRNQQRNTYQNDNSRKNQVITNRSGNTGNKQ